MTSEMVQNDDTKTGRLLMAIEMSLSNWGWSAAIEDQPRKRVRTFVGGDYRGLLEAVADFKARFKLLADAPVVFCYEASRDRLYPYRRLVELGQEVWVIDSASIEVSRHRRNAKSNRIDADKLVELMQRKAVARRLAVALWRYTAQGVIPAGAQANPFGR